MKADGGPAFPATAELVSHDGDTLTTRRIADGGMTLRDYFAAKAMTGYCSDPDWRIDMTNEATARCAYAMADEMLRARDA